MFGYIKELFGLDRKINSVETRVLSSEAHLSDLLKRSGRSRAKLTQSTGQMEVLQNRFGELQKQAQQELKQSRIDIERLEEALATARDELRTAKEITIPGLIASHEVLISRWEAETKIAVMRGVLADAPRSEE